MVLRIQKLRSSWFSPDSLFGQGWNHARGYQPRFEQLEPRMMLSTTTAIGNGGNWHDPNTWDNGVPTMADDVVIPSGKVVDFNGAAHVAKTLLIQGTATALESGATNKILSTDWILVDGGSLNIGSEANRYDTHTFAITLEGDNHLQNLPSLGINSNDAFLMSRAGGTLNLFGAVETSWTQLGATASGGATSITLKEAVTWTIGDEIVIASTTFDMNQAETRTITSVSGDHKTFDLNAPLSFSHYGELQFYDNGKGTNYELDERAEVGLLSRSIKIQGDADSTVDGIGGHLMFMPSSGAISIDGVELYHLGQKSQLARYPVHWHLAGDRTGDFVKNTSIHRSFNRAVVIHATHNVLIEQTVAYDHIGSGYFLENAVETGNKFYYNLGLVTREPAPGEEILPTDLGPKQFQISGPGTFWITNPNNEFIGNVAGGSQKGSGFWYALPNGPLNQSTNDPQYAGVNPQTVTFGLFNGNRAHSNAIGLDVDGGPNVVTDISESSHYSPPSDAIFRDFTAFANDKNGVYYRGTSRLKLNNARLADNHQSTMFAFGQTISNSLIVGVSGNDFGGVKKHGFAVYDGPNTVSNVHFAGFNNAGAGLFTIIGAASRHANHVFEQITIDDVSTPLTFPDTAANNNLSRHWGFSLYDNDGTLTGVAGQSIIYDHPMMRTDGDFVQPGWEKAVISQQRFGHLFLNHRLSPANQPIVTFERTEGPGADVSFTDIPQHEPFTQLGVVMNTDFVYTINYDTELFASTFNVNIEDVNAHDFVYLRVNSPWAGMTANSAIARNSVQEVKDSIHSAYYVEPSGAIFLKVYGFDDVNLVEAPASYLYADFESGIDPRASLAATHGGLNSNLNFSATFGSQSGVNHYQVIDNGDGIDGYVDARYHFSSPEDATGFSFLLFNTANEKNASMQIFIFDTSAGYTFLGTMPTGIQSVSLTSAAAHRRDQVEHILIRVMESSFSDLNSPGNRARININNISAVVTGTSTVVDITNFDSGVELTLAATHGGINSPLAFTANFGADGINFWDVIDNGDGTDGFVDLHMTFGPEDWTSRGGLRINTLNELNTPIQVFIRDASAGYTASWDLPTGEQWVSLSGIPAADRDEIDDLIIRVHESDFSDLVSPGNQVRIHLKHLEVTFEDPNPLLPSADFDTDGDIDGSDFLAWQRGLGALNASKSNGDADNDQDVDAADLATWTSQFGGSDPVAGNAAFSSLEQHVASTSAVVPTLSDSIASELQFFWPILPSSTLDAVAVNLLASESSPEEIGQAFRKDLALGIAETDELPSLSDSAEESKLVRAGSSATDEAFANWLEEELVSGLLQDVSW